MDMEKLIVVETGPLRYVVSPPPAYTPRTEPWPVLCFLHGRGEVAPMPILEALTKHGPLQPGVPQTVNDRFIVLAPQLPPQPQPLKDPALWSEYEPKVQEVVEEVQRNYNGDPKRTYLTGFSYGGNGALDFVSDKGKFWAARWPVDPTKVPKGYPQGPIWLSRGQCSEYEGFINLPDFKPAEDDLSGNRYFSDHGVIHAEAAKSAYRDDRIYNWLLTKHL